MNTWDIVRTVGSGIISSVVPGGGAIVSAINAFLPKDKKLQDTATGQEAANAIQALPADKRAELMSKQFDVDITQIKESNSTLRAMLESDAKNPHSTRPYIAKGAFLVVAFSIITIISLWAISVFNNNVSTVKAVVDGWPFVLAVMTPLVTLLYAYFGVLKHEHKNKLNAASGVTEQSGITGLISAVLKR